MSEQRPWTRDEIRRNMLGSPGPRSKAFLEQPRLRDEPMLLWGLIFLIAVLVVIGVVVLSFVILIVVLMWWGIVSIGGVIFP